MPGSRWTNSSSESFIALLEALGLSDLPDIPEESKNASPVADMGISCVGIADGPSFPQRPTSPFSKMDSSPIDEARIFGQDYLSDFDICSDLEEDSSDCDFEDAIPSRPGSSLESFEMIGTPVAQALAGTHYPQSLGSVHSQLSVPSPLSWIYSNETESPPPSPNIDALNIKAAHNASIIMLRTPRNITFAELKQRLYQKFVHQEGTLLSHSFSVVNVLPPPTANGARMTLGAASAMNRVRSGSASAAYHIPTRPSLGSRRVSFAERTEMRFIDREADWRKIVASHGQGSKITLRILDTPT